MIIGYTYATYRHFVIHKHMMKTELENIGFTTVESIYSEREIEEILKILNEKEISGQFGVREFLFKNPEIRSKIFNKRLKEIVKQISPKCTNSIKSIYFDKPPNSNWIVNWHQDLTINLSYRKEVDQYKNWRETKERTVVQPNRELLENIFTIRIHLDKCTKQNGALRVIEESHLKGTIDTTEWIKTKVGKETICEVGKGGILIMKPLLLHSSRRTENDLNRRVIHIEFTDQKLPNGLKWKERVEFEAL